MCTPLFMLRMRTYGKRDAHFGLSASGKLLRLQSALLLLCVVTMHRSAWCQSPSTYVRSGASEATIEVHADKHASFTIPRTVYGTFLEDIGHSVFGGVSAELIDNPSFEAYDASFGTLKERFSAPEYERATHIGLPLPWLPLRDHDGVRYEPRWGHAANSDRYLFLMGLPGREIGVRQMMY